MPTETLHMTLIKTAASEQESDLDHWISVDKAGASTVPPHSVTQPGGPFFFQMSEALHFPLGLYLLPGVEGEKEGGECLKQSPHSRALMVPLRHTEESGILAATLTLKVFWK